MLQTEFQWRPIYTNKWRCRKLFTFCWHFFYNQTTTQFWKLNSRDYQHKSSLKNYQKSNKICYFCLIKLTKSRTIPTKAKIFERQKM